MIDPDVTPTTLPILPDPRSCNRTACGTTLVRHWYWNLSTRAWYCEQCSGRINLCEPGLCVREDRLKPDSEAKFWDAYERKKLERK